MDHFSCFLPNTHFHKNYESVRVFLSRLLAFDQEAVRDVLADVASDLADKVKECTPRYFPVLAVDPSGFYLAFAPELFAADPSVN